MFERFARDAKAVVAGGHDEARLEASPVVEAEHLLLALARDRHPALLGAGLDHDALRDALVAERRHSLAAVGIELDAYPVGVPRPLRANPRFGTSSKVALQRSLEAATAERSRRIGRGHVLAGILRAEVGTVPRALALAGVDREELAASALAERR